MEAWRTVEKIVGPRGSCEVQERGPLRRVVAFMGDMPGGAFTCRHDDYPGVVLMERIIMEHTGVARQTELHLT